MEDAVKRPGNKLVQTLGLGVIYTLLILFSIVTLIPFAYMVCGAFKTQEVYYTSPLLPSWDKVIEQKEENIAGIQKDLTDPYLTPNQIQSKRSQLAQLQAEVEKKRERKNNFLGIDWDNLTFQNFKELFQNSSTDLSFTRATLNSFFFASITAILATLFSAMGGYALAKFNFKARGFLTTLVLAALIIPGPLLMVPGYHLIFKLGLLDTYTGLILPGLAPAFGVFLFRQAMLNSVPVDLIEAARIDGCGEIRLFFSTILPLVRPMVGAFLLITFLGTWNNFIGPQIMLQTPEKFPLAVTIAQFKGYYTTNKGLLMAGNIVSIAPIVTLFLLLQKEFISGLTSGAVKG